VDFPTAFDRAFDQLDSGRNFVRLAELRPALPTFGRAAFDAGLHELRAAGRSALSAAAGRHGISAAERQAGIAEEGAVLLFVSRRQ